MDPGIPVPPKGYGGHERLVHMFAVQYQKMGHQVDLLVSPGSEIKNCTVYSFGKLGFPPKKWDATMAVAEAWAFLRRRRNYYDLIHNFGRLVYLLPVLNHPVKKIMTYGREISRRNIGLISKLSNRNLIFTGCSADLVSRGNIAGSWQAVYNAIEFSKYTLNGSVFADAPLMFLGRLEQIKGCHTAIRVAKRTKNKLIIAGNISSLPEELAYFKKEIEPHIDGKQIQYVGQVDDQQKNHYLRQAKALLFPIEWNEPFGMVMTEAMACGTPVLGFRKGSVPEVIDEGITGFIVNNEEEMAHALVRVESLNRKDVRIQAEKRFDVNVVAKDYLDLFSR